MNYSDADWKYPCGVALAHMGTFVLATYGESRLALMMLAGYEQDMEKDAREGFYNPLVVGTWNLEAVRSTLLELADSVVCPELDAVITATGASKEWWKE